MQPKTRMTFRFDPPKPAPRPEPVKLHPVPLQPSERAHTEREHEKTDEQAAQPEAALSDRIGYYSGGPLQDDLYTLEEMIRNTEPIVIRQPHKKASIPSEPGVTPVGITTPSAPGETPAGITPLRVAREMSNSKTPAPEEVHAPELLTYSDMGPAELRDTGGAEHSIDGWLAGAFNRKESPSWWRVFASVAAAVATGALFGYLVLTLFTGQTPFPGASATESQSPVPAAAPQTSAEAVGQGVAPPAASPAGQSAPQASVTGSAFYLLQYGVFRTEDSMRAAMEELRRKGLPAAADRSDGYRVYAGAADSKEEAELLAAQLTGIEVYVKSSVAPTLDSKEVPEAAALADFMERSTELTRTFASLSVSALQEQQPASFDPAAQSTLRESHKLWLDSAKSTAELTGAALQAAKEVEQSLQAAMLSVDDYNRKPSRYLLWTLQSKTMQAVLADRALRAALHSEASK